MARWRPEEAARRMAGGVASAQVARDACGREEWQRGHLGVLSGPSWVQLAADAPWTRSTGGVRASGGGNREGDGGRDLFAISEFLGTSR